MRWYALIVLMVIYHYKLLAQKEIPIGLEVGIGHNSMTWKVKYNEPFNVDDTTLKRKELFITPSFRITYKFSGWELSEKVQLNLVTFIGYSAFGGKSEEYENGYKDKYIFNAVEIGAFPQFDFNSKIWIGPGVKGQYIFSAKSKSYGSVLDPTGTARTWRTNDVDKLFEDFSVSAGLAVRYKIRSISFGVETWFGITNLFKLDGEFVEIKVHENSYKFMIGIEL